MSSAKIIGIIILIILAWWLSPLYYITLYPASAEITGSTPDASGEPLQVETDLEPFQINDRQGGRVKIIPVADYEINGRVAVIRHYPNYFNVAELENVLDSDMALVWGKFAEDNIFKKVKFSHQWTYSTFNYRDPEINADPGINYLSAHFSSNHLIAANKNIKNAMRRVGHGDNIKIVGHLINLEILGLPLIKTSTVRTDNWIPGQGNTGGSEFIYVTEIQIENAVYR